MGLDLGCQQSKMHTIQNLHFLGIQPLQELYKAIDFANCDIFPVSTCHIHVATVAVLTFPSTDCPAFATIAGKATPFTLYRM